MLSASVGEEDAMATLKPIKFPGHTVTLTEGGFLGYVHYHCTRDSDGANIAGGGISRDNYATAKAHRAAILAACRRAVAEREARGVDAR
jgi:hypothetical protein